MLFKLDTALLFAATASALQITSPTKGTKLDLSKSNDLTWNSVESDPTSFDIELVNEHVNPPVAKTIATNVQTSAGSYTFNSMKAAVGYYFLLKTFWLRVNSILTHNQNREGYQINIISNEQQNTGILAQSPNFEVSDAPGTSSTVSATFTTTTGTSTSSSSTSTGTSSSTTTGSTSSSSKTASSTATTKTASASSSGVSSSSTSQPDTGAANALGVSAAMGGILGGGVLALLI
ncbi:uncharacterized protein TRUGW13939_05787 [Talaromyces rugulosus]|uniref:Yeast cell wall synthesis Kre9/Knh1-like N-terminal domain-containing protein n=1 Tax=Talaromyces rugulosus TaxID=121627 RepID=A0A7H8QX43_TALRU|nr:uncharacterized protein TRUGW13939_05787 [Talaromyces rugulosus]QKX58660.1 hypothetical protein TRUGW13939_05787 [Talaromyces rugulosus]